ncbi:hypothetical protein JTB14_033844 [Gonioctena quinquepunctata]|nr:hypothetical protein JTB14_033844 [Gonioctena quinquepunctata]
MQHSFRTYHQVQAWYDIHGNSEHWGWEISKIGLTSVKTTPDPPPEGILKCIAVKPVGARKQAESVMLSAHTAMKIAQIFLRALEKKKETTTSMKT